MPRKKSSQNSTIIRLRDTPFKTAAEMNEQEARILREEWEILERAKRRRMLLKKEEYSEVIAPFTAGFGARFVDSTGSNEVSNLVRVYLKKNDEVQIDIDDQLNTEDSTSTVSCLVKSVTESLINSYMGTTLGLKEKFEFPPTGVLTPTKKTEK